MSGISSIAGSSPVYQPGAAAARSRATPAAVTDDGAPGAIGETASAIYSFSAESLERLSAVASSGVDALGDAFDDVGDAIGSAVDSVGDQFEAWGHDLAMLAQDGADAVAEVGDAIGEAATDFAHDVEDAVSSTATAVGDAAGSLADTVGSAARSAASYLALGMTTVRAALDELV